MDFEKIYSQRDAKELSENTAKKIAEHNTRVDFIHATIPRLLSLYADNPPREHVWFYTEGGRQVAWTCHINGRSRTCLLPDGTVANLSWNGVDLPTDVWPIEIRKVSEREHLPAGTQETIRKIYDSLAKLMREATPKNREQQEREKGQARLRPYSPIRRIVNGLLGGVYQVVRWVFLELFCWVLVVPVTLFLAIVYEAVGGPPELWSFLQAQGYTFGVYMRDALIVIVCYTFLQGFREFFDRKRRTTKLEGM